MDTNQTENAQPALQENVSEYTPPATQADLDRIIGERLSRERAKFADYEDLQAKAAQLDAITEADKTEQQKLQEQLAASEARVAEYELADKIRGWASEIAKETGVPAELLRGGTEAEMRAHAEALKTAGIGQAETSVKTGLGPYVPGEGSQPDKPVGNTGDMFAAFLENQLS